MKIVFFFHPAFSGIRSISKYSQLLIKGMQAKGYAVETWSPKAMFSRLPFGGALQKWMGYLDQYLLFPLVVRYRVLKCSEDTLFVFTDNAQGPWVPLVANKKHVVHCHDFLAQRSALGEIPENITGWTGRQYQALIRWGLCRGKNFISVSENTRTDLHNMLPFPVISEVVYNGFNQNFSIHPALEARMLLGKRTGLAIGSGYLLHVGGNTWYKNRCGVIKLYDSFRSMGGASLPLLLIGEPASADLLKVYESSPFQKEIFILNDIEDDYLRMAYAGALVFIFPSLAEGFGWPIAEAMASGCPVITTGEAPMTEVGGNAAFYISRRPRNQREARVWATEGAEMINKVIKLLPEERKLVVEQGFINAQRFNADCALNKIEAIYQRIIQQWDERCDI